MAEKSNGGRQSRVYRVGKRDSYVIVAQLSPEFASRLEAPTGRHSMSWRL